MVNDTKLSKTKKLHSNFIETNNRNLEQFYNRNELNHQQRMYIGNISSLNNFSDRCITINDGGIAYIR